MDLKTDYLPAFPHDTIFDEGRLVSVGSPGMSLRDWFAGQAMHGRLASMRGRTRDEAIPERVAENAYRMADAMIKARDA